MSVLTHPNYNYEILPGSRTKGTFSFWCKHQYKIGDINKTVLTAVNGGSSSIGYKPIYEVDGDNTNGHAFIGFNNLQHLAFKHFTYSSGSPVEAISIVTDRKFLDQNAWYHIVVNWDTSQSIASNRVKVFVNGIQETSFSEEVYPTQNLNLVIGSSYNPYGSGPKLTINGSYNYSGYMNWEGYLTHVHSVDNQQLDPSVFGYTDATTGEWAINGAPSITYTGTSTYNFFLLKDGLTQTNPGYADEEVGNGNVNDWEVSNDYLNSTDSPNNVFASWDLMHVSKNSGDTNLYQDNTGDWESRYYNGMGNCTISYWSPYTINYSSLAASSGKFYAEFKGHKPGSSPSTSAYVSFGISDGALGEQLCVQNSSNEIAYFSNGDLKQPSGTTSSYGSSFLGDNILGIAMDLDNMKLYFFYKRSMAKQF